MAKILNPPSLDAPEAGEIVHGHQLEPLPAATASGRAAVAAGCCGSARQQIAASVDLEYDRFIQRLAESGDMRTISNSCARHALSIFRAIFRNAKESVSIFSGCLAPIVFNDAELAAVVDEFLKRGGAIRVLLQDQDIRESSASKVLVALMHKAGQGVEQVSIKQVGPAHPFCSVRQHFAVSDRKSYRLETNPVDHTAVGSFMDVASASTLTDVFDRAFGLTAAHSFSFAGC